MRANKSGKNLAVAQIDAGHWTWFCYHDYCSKIANFQLPIANKSGNFVSIRLEYYCKEHAPAGATKIIGG